MVDACIVAGQQPEAWQNKSVHVLRQKDTDARWTKKRHKNDYDYKNHINSDAEYKIIRKFEVTAASQADIHAFERRLDERNSSKRVSGDSAYRSEAAEEILKERGYSCRGH